MDVFNSLYFRMLGAWTAASPRARLTAAIAATVVIFSLVYIVRREAVGETTYLLGGQSFSIAETTAIQAALGKAQLNDFTVEGNRIGIPRKKQAAYLAALADAHALPKALDDVLSDGIEPPSLITTRQSQTERIRVAKKRGLSLILRSIENVESAEVDFDKDEPRGLKQERIAAALVAVKLRGGQALTEGLANYFQTIAAAALNMAPRDVTVVDKTNHIAFGGRDSRDPRETDDHHDLKRKYQAYYEETVRKALAYVPGVTVTADVELSAEPQGEHTRAELDANRAATVHSAQIQTVDDVGTAAEAPNRESLPRPGGVSATIMNSLLPLGSGGSKVAGLQDNRPQAAADVVSTSDRLVPKRVAISVGVPLSYFVSIWQQGPHGVAERRDTMPSEAELALIQADEVALIRQHVAPLIPDADNPASGPRITVTAFSHSVVQETVDPSIDARAAAWLRSPWGIIGLGVVSLMTIVVWRVARRVIRPAAHQSAVTSPADSDSVAHPGGPHAGRQPRARAPAGRTLRDELADMVRDNPAAAADVLRSWIGNSN